MTGGSTGQHAVFCGNGDTWAPKAHGPASLPWMAEVSIVSPPSAGIYSQASSSHSFVPEIIFACRWNHGMQPDGRFRDVLGQSPSVPCPDLPEVQLKWWNVRDCITQAGRSTR